MKAYKTVTVNGGKGKCFYIYNINLINHKFTKFNYNFKIKSNKGYKNEKVSYS
ncbi:hypothetical protein CSPB_0475 [Campylobacter sputorum subsp. bovis]|nr:hypothetical protein CSPB_0475 [Campylobacter sputorum]